MESTTTSCARIAHIVPVFRLGGILRTLQLLAGDENRTHCYLSVFDANSADATAALSGARCLRLPATALQDQNAQIRAIADAVSDLRADIVHTHHFFVDLAAAAAARALNLPCVRTVHGVTQRVQTDPFKPVVARDNWNQAEIAEQRRLQDFGVLSVAVSAELRAKLLAHGFTDATTVLIVPAVHSVPMSLRPTLASPLLIAYPHRLEPVKAPHLMIDVIQELRNCGLDVAVRAPAIGDLCAEISCAVEQRGLSPYVQILPAGTDIWERIGPADLCLLTSYSEGLPFSLLEAMARALPIVATRVGGVPEVVQGGVTGLLCDPDPFEIARAVELLATDQGLRHRMGAAGRQTAIRDFSVPRFLEEHGVLYARAERNRWTKDWATTH